MSRISQNIAVVQADFIAEACDTQMGRCQKHQSFVCMYKRTVFWHLPCPVYCFQLRCVKRSLGRQRGKRALKNVAQCFHNAHFFTRRKTKCLRDIFETKLGYKDLMLIVSDSRDALF